MANRTDAMAASVHGTNPQNLVEKILRMKIYSQLYWKEHCFGLSAEGIVDKAVELRNVGGTYGGTRKATDFMCLVLKMLQIQPEKDIVIEFIKNEDFKYVRILGAFYLRLVGRPLEVYQYLEPLYNDYRKVRLRGSSGAFELSYVDVLVDQMLTSDYMFDIALPHLPASDRISISLFKNAFHKSRMHDRRMLETIGQLDPRQSVLDDEFDEAALEAEAGDAARQAAKLEAEMGDGRRGAEERTRDATPEEDREYLRSRREDRDREKWRLKGKDRDRRARRSRSRGSSGGRSRSPDYRDRRDRERDRPRRDDSRDRGRARARDHRSRSNSPDRGRRRHGGSRSRSRDRGHRDRRSPDRRDDQRRRDRERDRPSSKADKREKEAKEPKDKAAADEDLEIAEANALRAKLGLKPLRN